MALIARISFYPSLIFNVCMEKITSRKWYDKIDETVILGAIPFKSMIKQLVEKENVQRVISLNEDHELKYGVCNARDWDKNNVEFLHLPTTDFIATPSIDKIKAGVEFINKSDGCVYIHCKAGRTRSATIVACYLMSKYGYDPEKAFAEMKKKRPHVLLRPNNWESLKEFHSSLT